MIKILMYIFIAQVNCFSDPLVDEFRSHPLEEMKRDRDIVKQKEGLRFERVFQEKELGLITHVGSCKEGSLDGLALGAIILNGDTGCLDKNYLRLQILCKDHDLPPFLSVPLQRKEVQVSVVKRGFGKVLMKVKGTPDFGYIQGLIDLNKGSILLSQLEITIEIGEYKKRLSGDAAGAPIFIPTSVCVNSN